MNLKDFLVNKDTQKELYWSLVLEENWVQSGIWYIGESAAQVISVSTGAAWETDEELTEAVDAVLSSAVQNLPEDYQEPTKTVFGVPSSWVKEGEITSEYLDKIKRLCTDLSLTPVGFVVLPEAIAHLYKSEEGAPVSTIIIGLGRESIEISVFKLGTLVGTTQVSRSVTLIEDVIEGLSRFESAAPLPSRVIIYDGKGSELSEAKEIIMQASWEDNGKINFLHTPKAEILTPERKVLATSLAGANEIGSVSAVVTNELDSQVEEVTPNDFGFSVNQDVSQILEASQVLDTKNVEPVAQSINIPSGSSKVSEYLQKTKNLFHNFSNKFTFHSSQDSSKTKRPTIVAAIIIAMFLVVGGYIWWFYPKANIVIYASPKKFEQEADISFTSGGEADLEKGLISAEFVTSKVSGDKTKATTGTKTVGDKAKGSVRVQNGTAFPINLTSGIFLISSGGLKFGLDNSASVSAALSPTSPGTATVSVTADTIGAEFNLPKDEVFKVGNYPKAEVDGTSTADFSGGSSQEISAVDKNDQTTLESQLLDELVLKAKDELGGGVTESQIFVNDLAGVDTVSKTFDHKINEEATNLKLSLSLSAKGVVADKSKLFEYARKVLKDKVPSGFVLRDTQIDFKFTFVDQVDNLVNYKVVVSANFLPEVSTESLVKQIAGKTKDVTERYLSGIPGFTRAKVTIKPKLPGFFGTLPRISKNISIEIVPEE